MSFSYDQVVKVFCEWDIGIEDAVFETEATARAYVKEALVNCDIEESISELEAEGLLSFDWISLVSID